MTAPPGPEPMAGRVTDPYAPETVQSDADSSLATEALMERLLDQVRASMRVDTVAILLFDASEQFLVATAARGIEEEVRQGVRVRAGAGFAGQVAAQRRPIILDQISPANVVNPLLLRRGIVSMLGVPLFREHTTRRSQVIGVLHVGSLVSRKFGPDDVAALEQAARGVSSAIVRHRAFVDRTAAAALQNSLESRLPTVPGMQLAARYIAGSQYGVGRRLVRRVHAAVRAHRHHDRRRHGARTARGDGDGPRPQRVARLCAGVRRPGDRAGSARPQDAALRARADRHGLLRDAGSGLR